jgi:hypothetical protein
MSAQLDDWMARTAWELLVKMRATDPVGYREFFANLIPLDALPSEVYSDRQLEVIYGAVMKGWLCAKGSTAGSQAELGGAEHNAATLKAVAAAAAAASCEHCAW